MDSEDEDGAGIARETPVAGAGARLRTAREALGFDLSQIAAETRIPMRHLQAIEDGNFESLPSRTYAIGFSRSYAKAVELDETVITDAVRAELADGSMRRSAPASEMEPGDPARLPSGGLAWAGAIAALLLVVGAIAFANSYFAAGTEPGPLTDPAPEAGTAPATTPSAATTTTAAAPAANGPVELTALADGVWLRLYEQGGERLAERTLALGEAITVSPEAADPRINTGRPDALAITVGGQTVAKLADRAITISGVPVSAAALLARSAPAAEAAPAPDTAATAPARRPVTRRTPAPRPAPTAPAETAANETAADPGPAAAAPASEPATASAQASANPRRPRE